MIVYHSGGGDKDWLTVLTYQREFWYADSLFGRDP